MTYVILRRAQNLVRLGAVREAVRLADEAVARSRAAENPLLIIVGLLWTAEAEIAAGDRTSALARINTAARASARLSPLLGAEWLLNVADLHERLGEDDRATAVRTTALTLAETIDNEQGRRLRDRAVGQRTP